MDYSRIDTARGASCRVLSGGQGPDVVFFHGAGGLAGCEAFLGKLSESFRVHAPELPGFGESTGEELLEDMLDFTLHGWDVVDALGLGRVDVVAHSMGAMIAGEMAAVSNDRVGKLALLAPAGLWDDAEPIPDIFAMTPMDMPGYLFHDPAQGAAALTGGMNFDDDEALVAFFVDNARRLGTAGKMLFPIPNRRLSKRLYRLRAATLLVWGESDRMIPPSYAARWQELVPGAELVTVPRAGHMALAEQPEQVAAAVEKFLAG